LVIITGIIVIDFDVAIFGASTLSAANSDTWRQSGSGLLVRGRVASVVNRSKRAVFHAKHLAMNVHLKRAVHSARCADRIGSLLQ
uniref:Transposase n=1 Tax=Gongylonema pulchrum TaxID=637853 RepID=A0A183DQS4_9BILA